MSTPIRLAVIGAGHLGRFHARLAAASQHFELVGVVDPLPQARQSVAEELGVEPHAGYGSWLSRIDAAVVATPTQQHHAVCVELLAQDKHVLVEKPIAATLAQANEMVARAADHDRVLQVGHIERFNPGFAAVAAAISAPKYIEARRLSGYTGRSTDIGVVLDLMIHDMDLVLATVRSKPVQIDALGVSVFGDQEDIATARITFENGCVANLTASRVSFHAARDMQIWSGDGFVGLDFAARTAKIVRPSELVRSHQMDPGSLTTEQKQHLKDRLFQDYLPVEEVQAEATNALADELDDFARAIQTGVSPRVPGSAGRDALAACEQVLASIQLHAWDGQSTGRAGPLAPPAQPTLRPPQWQFDTAPKRRAG